MMPLSDAAMSVWAKSSFDAEERRLLSLPLAHHLLDTGSTMRELFERWVPASVDALAAQQFPDTSRWSSRAQLEAAAVFLASVHDIGKATPAFACQVPALSDRMSNERLVFDPAVVAERKLLPHGLAGDVVVNAYLTERGVAGARALASVVGGHHGIPPSAPAVGDARQRLALLGASGWEVARQELLDLVVEEFELAPHIASWATLRWSEPVLVVLSGLLIVADWLASNTEYFPLFDDDANLSATLEREFRTGRVSRAVSQFQLPAPWNPRDMGLSSDGLLRTRFALPADATVTTTQDAAVVGAREMELPGLMIVQDVMGAGKTEAAFMAAEILAARTGRRGCLFALPTQATTDAMFSRTLTWLERISANYGDPTDFSIQLMHGRAHLNDQVAALRRAGYDARDRLRGAIGGDDVAVVDVAVPNSPGHRPHADDLPDDYRLEILPWFSGRKRSILADFVISTVDHVLFAAMRSPHLALRHLGLERKVVVIDEVHSYSSYMNVYLERALEWLAALGVPVVLLSATLSHAQTGRFVAAYRAGLESQAFAGKQVKVHPDPIETPYPCLVTSAANVPHVVATRSDGPDKVVTLRELPRDVTLGDQLAELLADGGCALVVRNTVRSAQETFRDLSERLGDDVTLVHARFTIADRQAKDASLLERFGHPRHGGKRPFRAVVVATQVVEQSLDVDFDILVTDLAPIDLVLQRIGRLHRHVRPRPARLANPTCFVDHLPSLTTAEPYVDHGSAAVYGDSVLLRSAAVLRRVLDGGASVVLPRDMTELLEGVYGPSPNIPARWLSAVDDADRKAATDEGELTHAAEAFLLGSPRGAGPRTSLHGWLESSAQADDGQSGAFQARAQVRDGDDSIEVLLVERDGETIRTLPGGQGEVGTVIPTDHVPDRETARRLALSAVRLPAWCVRAKFVGQVLDELERGSYLDAWQSSPVLRGQLLLPLVSGRAVLAGRPLVYDHEQGLRDGEQ